MKHVISILVEDRIGSLARIVELFTSRGYNLDSICSGEAEKTNHHRLTIVTRGDDQKIGHILKLMDNLVNVLTVNYLSPSEGISRELMLVKVRINPEIRSHILQLVNAYKGTVIELNHDTLSFEVVGTASKLDGVSQIFREFELLEVARTGEAAIHR